MINVKDYIKILTASFIGNEQNVMRTFNCNPKWPICLYDFTYKNRSNEYQTFRLKNTLSHYVVEDFYYPENTPEKEATPKVDETDVLREYNAHLCTCKESKGKIKNEQFV